MAKKKLKKKVRLGGPPDPEAVWNEPVISVKKTLAQIERMQKKLEQVPPPAWIEMGRFLSSMVETAVSIGKTIQIANKVTGPQKKALDSFEVIIDREVKTKGG